VCAEAGEIKARCAEFVSVMFIKKSLRAFFTLPRFLPCGFSSLLVSFPPPHTQSVSLFSSQMMRSHQPKNPAKRAKTSRVVVARFESPINIVISTVLGFLDSNDAHAAFGTCYAWSTARRPCELLTATPKHKFTSLLSRCVPKVLRKLNVRCNLFKHNVQHIGTFSNLQYLSFTDCPQVTPTTLAMLEPLKQLEGLSLTRCSNFDQPAMAVVAKQFQGLQHLTLCNCAKVGNGVIKQVPQLTSLRELEVYACHGSVGFECLAGMALEKLLIWDCPGLKNLTFLLSMQCLKYLALQWQRLVSCDLIWISRVTTLTELDLYCCRIIGDAGFVNITPFKVEKLSVSGCAGVEEAGWATLLPKFPNVKHLDLSNLTRITDNVIDIIPASVERLNLSGCGNVRGDRLNYLTRFESLRALDFSGLRFLPDMGFLLNLHRLEELILSNCKLITLATFRIIAQLPEITKLSFANSLRIEAGGLLALANQPDGSEGVPKLQWLILFNCFEVTDEIVRQFMSRPTLVFIDVRNCPHVTNAELSRHRHVSVVK